MSEAGTISGLGPELLGTRGAETRVDGFVTHAVASRDGLTVAVATAEGDLYLIPRDGLRDPTQWQRIEAHDGAVLDLCADAGPDGFLSGGEDSRLLRTASDGTVTELHRGRRWVDCVASFAGKSAKDSVIAFSTGKQVELRDAAGNTTLKVLEHPSTVTGLVFDAKGKRIAASHYNGASMWFVQAKVDTVRGLAWKGSHIGVAIHPGGDALVTSMQENDLHGWRLSDGHNMRMSGYPRQVASIGFSRNGRWLATSGADAIVLWPFFGGGPMGKAPTELARLPGVFCSQVAPHPVEDVIAAGFENGIVLIAEIASERVLPLCGPGRGKVSALCFTPQGGALVFGTEDGVIGTVDLSAP
jgi:WD40 repeat protein